MISPGCVQSFSWSDKYFPLPPILSYSFFYIYIYIYIYISISIYLYVSSKYIPHLISYLLASLQPFPQWKNWKAGNFRGQHCGWKLKQTINKYTQNSSYWFSSPSCAQFMSFCYASTQFLGKSHNYISVPVWWSFDRLSHFGIHFSLLEYCYFRNYSGCDMVQINMCTFDKI